VLPNSLADGGVCALQLARQVAYAPLGMLRRWRRRVVAFIGGFEGFPSVI